MLRPFLQTLAALMITLGPDLLGSTGSGPIETWRLLACLLLPLGPLIARIRRPRGRPILPGADLLRRLAPVIPLGLHGVALYGLDWPGVVVAAGLAPLPVIHELALLYPYVAALSSLEAAGLGCGRFLVSGPDSWWRRIAWRWRRETLVIVPFFAFVALDGLLGVGPARPYAVAIPALTWGAILVLFGLLGLGFPFLMVWSMGWRPLPRDSARRRRLEAILATHRFVCRDFLLWRTGGAVANAAIVGITARTRFIMVTDGLLAGLDPDELAAVLAHEVGHGHRRHVQLFATYALAWMLLLREADAALAWRLSGSAEVLTAGDNLVLALVWLVGLVLGFGVIFGFLSRRFEREADLFAAHRAGGAALFSQALRRVSLLAGIGSRRRFWRHDSTATRTAFVERLGGEGGLGARRRFEWQMRGVRLGIVALSLVAGVLFVRSMVAGSLVGLGAMAFERDEWTLAADRIARGIEIGEHDPTAYRLLLEAYRHAGRLDAACEVADRIAGGSADSGARSDELTSALEALADDLESAGRGAASRRVRTQAGDRQHRRDHSADG